MVLRALDKKKTGNIPIQKIVDWLCKGMKLTEKQRQKYKAGGSLQTRMITFLEIVEDDIIGTSGVGAAKAADSEVAESTTKLSKEEAISKAVEDLFKQYDVDGNGCIDVNEFTAMMLEQMMSQGRGSDISIESVKESATLVMGILDTDKSNTLEPLELEEWLVEGMKMGPVKRREFASNGEPQQMLIRFIASIEDSIPVVYEEKACIETAVPGLAKAVQTIFRQYDEDGSGAIDLHELALLMKDLTVESGRKCTDVGAVKAAEKVMKILIPGAKKKDQQLLTESAFAQWVEEGLKMPPLQRRDFASRGEAEAQLVRFLRAAEQKIQEIEESTKDASASGSGSSLSEADINQAIRKLFISYDADGSGAIDTQEMASMITELQLEEAVMTSIDHNTSINAAKIVIQTMNANKDGGDDALLQQEDFQKWVQKGRAMPATQRKAFAAQSEVNGTLCRFLRAVERSARLKNITERRLSRGPSMMCLYVSMLTAGKLDSLSLSPFLSLSLSLSFFLSFHLSLSLSRSLVQDPKFRSFYVFQPTNVTMILQRPYRC